MLYMTQRFPHGLPGNVKLGYSSSKRALARRLVALQVGADANLRLVGAIAGGEEWEKFLHALLSEHHIRGEWFRPHPEVRDAFDAAGILADIAEGRKIPLPVEADGQLRLRWNPARTN